MLDILIMLFFMSFFLICLIVLFVIGLYAFWSNLKTDQLDEPDKRIFR
jgi:nitrogen fixation-related uncharacterized protein